MLDCAGTSEAFGELLRFLLREMDRARLCQLPVAVGLLQPENPGSQQSLLRLAEREIRSFDLVEPLSESRVAIVLSVTSLAAGERLLGSILRRARRQAASQYVCSAGLASYGGCANLTPEEFLDRAAAALALARSLGGNRLEVAPSDVELASRETLVCANEKRFLFTGGVSSTKQP